MNISFVVAVTDEDEALPLLRTIKEIRGEGDEIIFCQDAPSIAAAYNEGLSRATNEGVCLIHQDVELRPTDWWGDEKLGEYLNDPETGFIGVAGSKDSFRDGRWFVSGNRLCGGCFHSSAEKKKDRHGATCADTEQSAYKEWFTPYGDYGRVVIADGVVLVGRRETFEKVGGFDEVTYGKGWHLYDLDITLRAHMMGYKNYVLPIMVCHRSAGSYNANWATCRELFVKKFEDTLPVVLDATDDKTIVRLSEVERWEYKGVPK